MPGRLTGSVADAVVGGDHAEHAAGLIERARLDHAIGERNRAAGPTVHAGRIRDDQLGQLGVAAVARHGLVDIVGLV